MIVIGIDPSLTNCGVSDGEHHEVIQTKPGPEDIGMIADISRRCGEIVNGIAHFMNTHYAPGDFAFCVEAPMLTALQGGADFLFEAGWLYNDLFAFLRQHNSSIYLVPTSTLRKWATGKGNAPKDEMKLRAFKKFGVEMERDPGCDKLFAFLLSKFGQAIEAGEVEFVNPKRRGAGKRAKAAVRKRGRAA